MGQNDNGKIIIRKLRFGDQAPDGCYYAVIGDRVVVEDGRCFWPAKHDAIQSALRTVNEARPR